MSFGAKKDKSSSSSEQVDYGSNVWQPQQGYLTDLWSRAQGQSMAQTAGADSISQAGGQLGMGAGMINQGAQMLGQAQQGLAGIAGQVPGQMNPQLQAYANQMGQLFNQQVMPALRGQAASAGQLGSSRAQLGQAAAADMAQRSLQDFAGQQYQADAQRQLQAMQAMQSGAGQMAGMGTAQGALASGYGQLAGQQAGLPWYGLQQFSALLGSPILQDLGGRGTTSSSGKSGGFNIGLW